MKNRIIALLLALAAVCSLLAGCMKAPDELTSQPSASPELTQSTAVQTTLETPDEENDGSPTPKADKADTEQETPKASAQPSAAVTAKPEEDSKALCCTLSIDCKNVFSNIDELDKSKRGIIPADGVILSTVRVEFEQGETVYDVLQRVCRQYGIQLEASYTPGYGSAYVEGINNLYEFDCGEHSGWKYTVNGVLPNFGCSAYELKNGDDVQWRYTCAFDDV